MVLILTHFLMGYCAIIKIEQILKYFTESGLYFIVF